MLRKAGSRISKTQLPSLKRASLHHLHPRHFPIRSWVRQVLPALQARINSRQHERPPKAVRFKSDLVNDKGYFDPIEVGRTFGKDRLGNDLPGTFYWYFIAVLDLYDCVWICRRCFSASDVWMRTECRPPARCPNCGYATGQDAPAF